MSRTEKVLSEAHKSAASATGEIAVALARRSVRAGDAVKWSLLLRRAADELDELRGGDGK